MSSVSDLLPDSVFRRLLLDHAAITASAMNHEPPLQENNSLSASAKIIARPTTTRNLKPPLTRNRFGGGSGHHNRSSLTKESYSNSSNGQTSKLTSSTSSVSVRRTPSSVSAISLDGSGPGNVYRSIFGNQHRLPTTNIVVGSHDSATQQGTTSQQLPLMVPSIASAFEAPLTSALRRSLSEIPANYRPQQQQQHQQQQQQEQQQTVLHITTQIVTSRLPYFQASSSLM